MSKSFLDRRVRRLKHMRASLRKANERQLTYRRRLLLVAVKNASGNTCYSRPDMIAEVLLRDLSNAGAHVSIAAGAASSRRAPEGPGEFRSVVV